MRVETGYDVAGARQTISGIALYTPILRSAPLSQAAGSPILLKLENLQVTGSFKVRGAANRMERLTPAERARGVVACSSGNHGRAVAYVAERMGISATVCVPEWVDRSKLDAIRRHGAETIREGSTYDEAEAVAQAIERERGLTPVHPFDDPAVVSGQGTIGLEVLEQSPSVGTVVVPLSGGGLIAGIALAMKAANPSIRVVGVSADNARTMVESLRRGAPVDYPETSTIANALAGGIGLDNRHTFRLVRDYVDDHILVTEEEIGDAMALGASEHKLVIEGGGAVGIAAILSGSVKPSVGETVVVVSGGNVLLSSWCDVIGARKLPNERGGADGV